MSVLNFLLKNLQGCCLLFNYQGSFLLSSQRQLIYIITFTIACQQLFYFSFSLSASIISVVRNSLINIPCPFLIVNIIFIFYFIRAIRTIQFFTLFLILKNCFLANQLSYNIIWTTICQYFYSSFFTSFSH
mgnify:CR=1 FL=1